MILLKDQVSKRGVMGTKNQTVDKQTKESGIFVVTVPMEGRPPEEIARDAVIHIDALFDRLIEERKNNPK